MIFEGSTLTAEVTLTNKSAIHSTTVRGYFLFQGITKYYQQTLTKLQTMVIKDYFYNVTSGTSNLCMGGDYTDCIEVEVHPFWDALSPTDVGDNGDYGIGDNTVPVTIKNESNVSIIIPVLTIATYNSTSTHYDINATPGTSVHSFPHTIVTGTPYGLTDCVVTLHKEGFTDKTLEDQIKNWEAPTQTAHTSNTPTMITINWNEISDADGGYQWECSTDVNFSVITLTGRINSSSTVTKTMRDLTNNTTYYTRIRAKYIGETFSRWSNVVSSKTFTEIGVVTNLPGSNITTTSFNANWSVPASGLFDGYLLWITTNNSTPLPGFDGKDVGNVNTYNISGLAETKFGTQYYTYAKAYNASVTGTTNYMYNSVQLQGERPAAPATPTAYNVFGVSFEVVTTGVAGETNNPIYNYYFDLSLYSDFRTLLYDNVHSDFGTFGKSLGFTGLTITTTYYVRCRAKSANSAYSDVSGTLTKTTATPPPAPVQGEHTLITQTTFTMNWTNSVGANNTRITVSTVPTCDSGFVFGYNNLYIPDPPVNSRLINQGLSPYTTYYTKLIHTGAGGNSPFSNIVSSTTLPTVPSAPTINATTNVTTSSFTLNWTPNGSMPITGYIITIVGEVGYRDLDVGNVLTYDITGLDAGTSYECHVIAYNVSGNGTTAVSNKSTSQETPVQTDITSVSHSSFVMNWNAVNSATRGYKLEISSDVNFTTIVKSIRIATVSTITKEVTELVPNTQYWTRLYSQGIGEVSPWSNVKTTTTSDSDPNLYLHWSDSYYQSGQYQCQWNYYQFVDNITRCWLVDYQGNLAVNPYSVGIEVLLSQTGVYCGGQPYGTIYVTIAPGASSGSMMYVSSGTEDCGRGCEQFGGYTDDIISITNSTQVPRIEIA